MGPQVSEEQLNRIKGYVDIARAEGATVLTGGAAPQLDAQFHRPFPLIKLEAQKDLMAAQAIR